MSQWLFQKREYSVRFRLDFYCLPEPVCERIFEQTKHWIVVVLASELTVLSYLNVSSVIPWGKRHFLPSKSILGKP